MKLPPRIVRSRDGTEARDQLENPLDYPGLFTRPRSKLVLRLWRYPSFEPQCSWAIIEAEGELFLRRVVRDPFRGFTYGSETPFEKSAYDKISAELGNVQLVPFEAIEGIGLDGTSYGIERVSSHASLRICWWESPPFGWTALQKWHQKATEIFDSVLPLSTASFEYESGGGPR